MDNSQLTLFSESVPDITINVDDCYEGLPADVIVSLEARAFRIRTIEHVADMEIAKELHEAKQEISPYKDGGFKGWVERKTRYTESYAYQLIHSYEQFGKTVNVYSLSNSARLRLSGPNVPQSARDEAIKRSESGEKITVKMSEEIVERHKAEIAKLEDEKQRIQSQFEYYKQDAKQREESLNARIDELEDIPIPEPQVVYEDTPETKEKLKKLKEAEDKLKQLEEELQDKKSLLQMKDSDLQERTQQRDNLSKSVKELGEELDKTRDANKARHEQEIYEFQINDRVQKITEEWGKTTAQFLGQLPSPIEGQVVSPENWALIDHAVDMAHRVISTIKQLKEDNSSRIIDAN